MSALKFKLILLDCTKQKAPRNWRSFRQIFEAKTQLLKCITCFFQNSLDAIFVDGTNGRSSHFHFYPFAQRRNKEFLLLQIGEKFTSCSIVSARYIVTYPRSFARNFTNFGHDDICFVRIRLQKSEILRVLSNVF